MKKGFFKGISKIYMFVFCIVIILLLSSSLTFALFDIGVGYCGDTECDPADGESTCTCTRDCGVGCTQNPESGGTVRIKMDVPNNRELYEFYLQGGGSCGISLTEEDSGFGIDDSCSTNANSGSILNSVGGAAFSDVANGCFGSCGDSAGDCPADILWSPFYAYSKNSCGSCDLNVGGTTYAPRGGLLCASGKWWLCNSGYHGNNPRLFTISGQNYICNTDNSWQPYTGTVCCGPGTENCQIGCCENGVESNYCCQGNEVWNPTRGRCEPQAVCGQEGELADPIRGCCSGLNKCADNICKFSCCGDSALNYGEQCEYTPTPSTQTQPCTSGSGTQTRSCTSSCQWPSTWDTSGCTPCSQGSVCSLDSQCSSCGLACVNGRCGTSTCYQGSPCSLDSQCSACGLACSNGGCCPVGQQWNGNQCVNIPSCGNGQINTGEDCDGSNLNGKNCQSLGYQSGTLGCTSSCTFNTASCNPFPNCGNGQINTGEDCDGSNLNGKNCQSLGYQSGTLGCTSSCTYDKSGCTTNGRCTVSVTNNPSNNACWTVSGGGESQYKCGSQSVNMPPGTNNVFLDFGSIPSGYTYKDASTSSNYPNCPAGQSMSVTWNFNRACTPESDSSFCSRYGKNCGSYTNTDNCGNTRTVNCGSCTSPQTCGGGGIANVCGGGNTCTVSITNNPNNGECSTVSGQRVCGTGSASVPPANPTYVYLDFSTIPSYCSYTGASTSGNYPNCPVGQSMSVTWNFNCNPPPPTCGNGRTDSGESCGEPGLPSCPAGKVCSNCQCASKPKECESNNWVPTGSGCGRCGIEEQFCDDNGKWSGIYECHDQGPCSPGSTQCAGTSYYSCGSNCHWSQHIGTDNDGDGVDRECGDSLCDNAYGVFDSTKTPTETNCADFLDNDCDGRRDCQDTDCAGRTGPGGVICCQTVPDCPQDDCMIESCVANNCQFTNRNTCDSTECISGRYCYNGDCTDGDNSEYVCLNCAPDTTTGRWDWSAKIFEDAGKAYSRNINVYDKLFDSNEGACPSTTCTKSGGCGCYDTLSTRTLIKRKRALATGNCCGDDLNEWYKKDYYGGECVSSVDQCVWSDGNAQPANTGNRQWWCNPGNWYECNDNTIGQGSPANPPPQGVCCAGTIGNNGWTPTSEVLPENQYSCTDGKDNDCDGKTDCDDNDCDGTLKGMVSSDNGQPIWQADITAKRVLANFKSASTNQQGTYSMVINCGTYNVVASHPDYGPETKGNLVIPPNQEVTADFTLTLGSSCESDCTFVADELVHASCHGKNGCSFYDDRAREVCDLSQPGWIRDYDGDNYVVCAEGAPKPKVEVEASVSCAGGTLVKVTRIVYYNGKPVKLVVAACG